MRPLLAEQKCNDGRRYGPHGVVMVEDISGCEDAAVISTFDHPPLASPPLCDPFALDRRGPCHPRRRGYRYRSEIDFFVIRGAHVANRVLTAPPPGLDRIDRSGHRRSDCIFGELCEIWESRPSTGSRTDPPQQWVSEVELRLRSGDPHTVVIDLVAPESGETIHEASEPSVERLSVRVAKAFCGVAAVQRRR